MEFPAWVNAALSSQLSVLRDSGESSKLEFKSSYPENGRDLAKEIAAFATSKGGLILIGVGDSGELLGVEFGSELTVRDELQKRLAGICRSTVKPAILVNVEWAVENSKIVMGIVVPEGAEPVYYASGVPYIRDLSTSRPAEPHEVVALVKEFLGISDDSSEPIPGWVQKLLNALLPVLIFGRQVEERMVDPWFGSWRAQFKYSAAELRDLVADGNAESELLAASDQLADRLEEVVEFQVYVGAGGDLSSLVSKALTEAFDCWDKFLGPRLSGLYGLSSAKPEILKLVRVLDSLGARAHKMLFAGASDEFLGEVSKVGMRLFQVALLHLRASKPNFYEQLAAIAESLHLVETKTLYMDGGRSQEDLMQFVAELRDKLYILVQEMYP